MINIIIYDNRVAVVRAIRDEFGVAVAGPVWLENGANSLADVRGLETIYGGNPEVVVSDLRAVKKQK